MGWIDESAPEHEGYLVAIVRDEVRSPDGLHVLRTRWRELSGLVHDEDAQRRYEGVRVPAVQVACECGWRSMRLSVPVGTVWRPHAVWLPRDEEDAFDVLAHELWRAHLTDARHADLLDSLPGPVADTTRFREEGGRVVEKLDRYRFVLRRGGR